MKNQKKKDVYQIITDLFIEKLEQGVVPWKKPWGVFGAARNYVSKKLYRGINQMILKNLHARPFYLTFHQAKQLGGKIRKGSQSIPVVFWTFLYRDRDTRKKLTEKEARRLPEDQVERFSLLRYYNVFNVDDIEDIEFKLPDIDIKLGNELILSCERIIADMPKPPKIQHQGEQAYYNSFADYVNMPRLKFFDTSEAYYSTLFHELVHSTGHEKRLDRPELVEISAFGSHKYTKEELTAEIGASFLNHEAGILKDPLFENSAAYIQGWLTQLQNDRKFIFEASAKAQKAVDYVLRRGL